MLSKIIQTEKDKYHINALDINSYIQNLDLK
jgi:hypothetical protein